MVPSWHKRRGYRHFDRPATKEFLEKIEDPTFVAKHSFSPLIHYNKTEKRYKKDIKTGNRTLVEKNRPIKYTSHRDAAILAYYSHILEGSLAKYYNSRGFSDSVIAYRPLGLANYDFSASALDFAKNKSPVVIMAFDVKGFFDNLDHALLKMRLKNILAVKELSTDWLRIFRFITRFHFVDLEALKRHSEFSDRFNKKRRDIIATVAELKSAGIQFLSNPTPGKGIPQGTPISASVSNLYMIEFDEKIRKYCDGIDAKYLRYSDDILVICKSEYAEKTEDMIFRLIQGERLDISADKTEKTCFNESAAVSATGRVAQYLGFTLAEDGAAIRQSSLARQWRKMRRAVKRTRKIAEMNIASGKSEKTFTKRLYKRFSSIKFYDGATLRVLRNFSSYARRSATNPSSRIGGFC